MSAQFSNDSSPCRSENYFQKLNLYKSIILIAVLMMASGNVLALSLSVTTSSTTADQFKKYEITLAVTGDFTNPFDRTQIQVDAYFTPPSGPQVVIPAFYYQEYTDNAGTIAPVGSPCFKVRFCPEETGSYSFYIRATDSTGSVQTSSSNFISYATNSKGFIGVSNVNHHYFSFKRDGSTFFPIGHNLSHPLPDLSSYFFNMSAYRENFTRIGMTTCSWAMPFENQALGVGQYDLMIAWKWDQVLNHAENNDIYIQLYFETFYMLNTSQYWSTCPYNSANGGPCENPIDFFTNTTAKSLFKQRLYYILSRYGYSTNVFAWELFNEIDVVNSFLNNVSAIGNWHGEMATFLKNVDPYGHIVSSSAYSLAYKCPELDYAQSHTYGAKGIGYILSALCSNEASISFPYFIAEFGEDESGVEDGEDSAGVGLHHGIWAPLFSGGAGSGMYWWWSNIAEYDLYGQFTAFANYLNGVDLANKPFAIASADVFPNSSTADIDVPWQYNVWTDHPSNTPQTFQIDANGNVTNADMLSLVIHGIGNHPTFHNPVTVNIDRTTGGTFAVIVTGVSTYGGANLRMYLDGNLVSSWDFPNDTQNGATVQYNGSYSINIPPGKHTVTVDNTGTDWLRIGCYRLSSTMLDTGATDTEVIGQYAVWTDHPSNTPQTFQIDEDGNVTGADMLSRIVHGVINHPTFHNPVTVNVNSRTGGIFAVVVAGVSTYGGANLKMYLDGALSATWDFPDNTQNGTAYQYNGVYSINIPSGQHTITVDNTGQDWLSTSCYRLTFPSLENIEVAGQYIVWTDHPSNTPQAIGIEENGNVTGGNMLSKVIHGTVNHPTFHNPVTVNVNSRTDGIFAVDVAGVSTWGGANLKLYLDGTLTAAWDFPDNTRNGTAYQYNGTYSINVPSGTHTITADNTGTDWLKVGCYRFTHSSPYPSVTPHSDNIDIPGIYPTWVVAHPSNTPQTFLIDASGRVTDADTLSRILKGSYHPTLYNPVTVNYYNPQDSIFSVVVNTVSGSGAILTIYLDGIVATTTQVISDTSYSINVPTGPHLITVDNTGTDWIMIDCYRFTITTTRPPLEVHVLADSTTNMAGDIAALGWLRQWDDTWYNRLINQTTLTPVTNGVVKINGLADGIYKVEWWDTMAGTVASTKLYVPCSGNQLTCAIPSMTSDMAFKVIRQY